MVGRLPPLLSCQGKTQSILSQPKITFKSTPWEVPRKHSEKIKTFSLAEIWWSRGKGQRSSCPQPPLRPLSQALALLNALDFGFCQCSFSSQ